MVKTEAWVGRKIATMPGYKLYHFSLIAALSIHATPRHASAQLDPSWEKSPVLRVAAHRGQGSTSLHGILVGCAHVF